MSDGQEVRIRKGDCVVSVWLPASLEVVHEVMGALAAEGFEFEVDKRPDERGQGERLARAIREGQASGQWSGALDLLRTSLVEPLMEERDEARAAAVREREKNAELRELLVQAEAFVASGEFYEPGPWLARVRSALASEDGD